MRKEKQDAFKRMRFYVLLLFVVSCVLHTALNLLIRSDPTVVIDEGLYTNIARSLAWDGELAFRGQPIDYPFLMYPFLLVPVYWINYFLKGDIYTYVLVFNSLLITSSVIPTYLFARDFTKDEKKAFLAAALIALMPDMVMGGYEMTECLLWPLSLWLFFFGYRFFVKNRYIDGCATALITASMFFTKPGAIVMGTVLLFACMLRSIRNKERSNKPAVVSLAMLLLLLGLFFGLYQVLFKSSSSLIGLYSKQTEEWRAGDILVAFEATALLVFLFVFACGGLFGVLPIAFLKQYSNDQKGFIKTSIAGVLAVIVGIAVFVVPYKWNGTLGRLPLHMRYCSMFIPVFYCFSLAVDVPYKKMTKGILWMLVVFMILSLFPGARSGFVPGKTNSIDSFAISAFTTTKRLNGVVMGWCVTFMVIASVLCFTFMIRSGWGEKLKRISTVYFAAFLLINSVCAHIHSNVYIDPTISADAKEVNELIGHQTSLGVTQRYYDDIYSYWLDGHLNGPMQQVTIDQMIFKMEESNGVYSPFVPVEQSPNVNNHATPDTDTLVLGLTVAEHLELNESVQRRQTSNGHFSIAKIQAGERWVDSMLYGMDGNTLWEGETGLLHVFDTERNKDGKLVLHITVSGSGSLLVQGQRLQLSREQTAYTLEFPFTQMVSIRAEGGNAQILSYTTEK